MGFLGRISGWDQTKDAHNAVAASHLAENASPTLKREIVERLIIINQHVEYGGDAGRETILSELNTQPRIVQMNFVALACNSLGIPPMLRGIYFAAVTNPYRAKNESSSRTRIEVACRDLSRRSGVSLRWPGDDAKEDFRVWTGKLPQTSPRRSGQLTDRSHSVELANQLMSGAIGKHLLRRTAENLLEDSTLFSDHQFALLMGMSILEQPDLKPRLGEVQLGARLIALQWFMEGEIEAAVLNGFEDNLYDLYLN